MPARWWDATPHHLSGCGATTPYLLVWGCTRYMVWYSAYFAFGFDFWSCFLLLVFCFLLLVFAFGLCFWPLLLAFELARRGMHVVSFCAVRLSASEGKASKIKPHAFPVPLQKSQNPPQSPKAKQNPKSPSSRCATHQSPLQTSYVMVPS